MYSCLTNPVLSSISGVVMEYQFKFFSDSLLGQHGGDITKGKRKERRPIAINRSMHITLRSSHAKGAWSFLTGRNAKFIKSLLTSLSQQHQVTLYESANSGTHLHLLLRAKSRIDFQRFVRSLSSQIARFVSGAMKGKPFQGKFFDSLFFSRIVSWGREYASVLRYIRMNTEEALGLIPYTPRRNQKRKVLNSC